MLNLLKKIYKDLPVIRELRGISSNVYELQNKVENGLDKLLLRTLQENYVLNLFQQGRYTDPKRLFRFEHQVFSQNGEDGIIREIFQRIGVSARTFLEIGFGNGLENNTTNLLTQGWNGTWVDADPSNCQQASYHFKSLLSKSQLKIIELEITANNINDIFVNKGERCEPDLLSLDIDRNTYWVWEKMEPRPRVIVVEYNATFPPYVDWKVQYDPNRVWNGSCYFGASLKAFEILGRKKGYVLVGCDLTGINAFFVRSDLCDNHFYEPYDAETHYEPARYFLKRTHGHPRCFTDNESSSIVPLC